jgi:hypothetical protein
MACDMARNRVLVLLGTLVLLAGCGGSARAPGGYAASGDAICGAQLAQLSRLTRPTTPEGAISYLPRALAIMQRAKGELTALHPPAPVRAQFAAGLADQGQLAALLHRVYHQLETGLLEIGTFTHVEAETDALRADISAHLRRAGLARCVA